MYSLLWVYGFKKAASSTMEFLNVLNFGAGEG
jgi:hypothetical protein